GLHRIGRARAKDFHTECFAGADVIARFGHQRERVGRGFGGCFAAARHKEQDKEHKKTQTWHKHILWWAGEQASLAACQPAKTTVLYKARHILPTAEARHLAL